MQYLSYSILFISIFIASCEPAVIFDTPMPPDVKEIETIPLALRGTYLCQSDSSLIHVSSRLVYAENFHTLMMPIKSIQETEGCVIIDGGLYLPCIKECIPFEYVNDSIVKFDVYYQDTLFQPSLGVLKFYKERLFINIEDQRGGWITHMVTPQQYGDLLWEMIDIPDDYSVLKDVSKKLTVKESPKSKLPLYIIKPTQIDFDEILNRDYTLHCETLTPVRINYYY